MSKNDNSVTPNPKDAPIGRYRKTLLETVEQYDRVIEKSLELYENEEDTNKKIKILWLISSNLTKKAQLFKNHEILENMDDEPLKFLDYGKFLT